MSVKELLEDEDHKVLDRKLGELTKRQLDLLERQIKQEIDKRNTPDWDLSELNAAELDDLRAQAHLAAFGKRHPNGVSWNYGKRYLGKPPIISSFVVSSKSRVSIIFSHMGTICMSKQICHQSSCLFDKNETYPSIPWLVIRNKRSISIRVTWHCRRTQALPVPHTNCILLGDLPQNLRQGWSGSRAWNLARYARSVLLCSCKMEMVYWTLQRDLHNASTSRETFRILSEGHSEDLARGHTNGEIGPLRSIEKVDGQFLIVSQETHPLVSPFKVYGIPPWK